MYGVRDEDRALFGRQVLTVWSGSFYSDYEGNAVELPKHDGYMVRLEYGGKIRVTCPAPRTEDNYSEVDEAISVAVQSARTNGWNTKRFTQ